jgi:DNA-binding beta-propeller fold protein YncE
MKNLLALCLLASTALAAQQIAAPTDLPGSPYAIKQTWFIGGAGNWDYLTVDPTGSRLFIAHSSQVQVVDLDTGQLAGQIPGLREAHAIALDDTGEFGYISDGLAGTVVVFDRQSLNAVATIPAGSSPRALVFEPQTRMLFVVGSYPLSQRPITQKPGPNQPNGAVIPEIRSEITVIDTQTRTVIGSILLPGRLGFAQAGGDGKVYVNIVDRNEIAWIDATAINERLHGAPGKAETARAEAGHPSPAKPPGTPVIFDWSVIPHSTKSSGNRIRFFSLGAQCPHPQSLAVDSKHQRLFATCSTNKVVVLDGATGDLVTSLPTGPGVETIGFDPEHGLIYTANTGAGGTLTIIHQDVTDTYAVIQNLPTQLRAPTLAVNPVTGMVYLVTDLLEMDLTKPGGIGTLETSPTKGSFQVLVVGN